MYKPVRLEGNYYYRDALLQCLLRFCRKGDLDGVVGLIKRQVDVNARDQQVQFNISDPQCDLVLIVLTSNNYTRLAGVD